MKFVDEAYIDIFAGDGGNGCASFRHEKYKEFGGPDGGDGGRGGHIYAVADPNLNTLVDYRYSRRYEARKGEHGKGSDMFGVKGDDITLKLPVGTIVMDAATGEVLHELLVPGEQIMLAKGGDGGFGNMHYKSSINRAPRQKTPGWPGERKELKLELKVLADVGLLGMPNAGKSTLISAISNARPKIADYPFTTLHPNLGVVRVGPEKSFVVADVPGLIEGAAEGAGLGHQFLRHLQRTHLLLHLVDVAPFDESVDPVAQAKAIVKELKKYDKALHDKPRWLVLNKLDMVPAEKRDALVKGDVMFKDGPVVLEQISVPCLAVAASEDHIVPSSSAVEPAKRFGSAVNRQVVMEGGHIGVVVGSLARRKLWPLLLEWLAEQETPTAPVPSSSSSSSSSSTVN